MNLESTDFYRVRLDNGVGTINLHGVLWNWATGQSPDFLVHEPSAGIDSVCP